MQVRVLTPERKIWHLPFDPGAKKLTMQPNCYPLKGLCERLVGWHLGTWISGGFPLPYPTRVAHWAKTIKTMWFMLNTCFPSGNLKFCKQRVPIWPDYNKTLGYWFSNGLSWAEIPYMGFSFSQTLLVSLALSHLRVTRFHSHFYLYHFLRDTLNITNNIMYMLTISKFITPA